MESRAVSKVISMSVTVTFDALCSLDGIMGISKEPSSIPLRY